MGITIEVNTQSLDEAIEKASRLVELLQEASHSIDSLSGRCIQGLLDALEKEVGSEANEALVDLH